MDKTLRVSSTSPSRSTSSGQLLATYLRLKAQGIVPFWPIIHGPTVSLYYRDPNGVKVELQYDVFRTAEEVDAFFAAGNYVENFMGVIFDPDDMVRASSPASR